MERNFRIIGKIGLLLVIFGFFMPIACDQNGFQLGNYMIENNAVMSGLLLYLLVLSAVAGAVIGVLLLMKKYVKPIADWVAVIVCIVSGLIVYFTQLRSNALELQYGAYIILAGWIIALAAQILSKRKSEA
jgi:predicted permease